MLFGSNVLEVAIGMIFVYLLLSLLCSAASELIASLWKFRAKDLERGITKLLSDQKLAEKFFKHPLVKPLYAEGKPAYVPARTFSLALWNIATEVAAKKTGTGNAGLTQDLTTIRASIESLADNALGRDIRESLLILIDEAKGDFDRARSNIEDWYDDAMDRVSGWYKKRTQMILILLGILFAAALNLDSVNIVRTLAHNPELRATIVRSAEEYVKQPLPPATDPARAADEQFKESAARIRQVRGEIEKLGLPVGWSRAEMTEDPRGRPQTFWGWLLKAFGILLTGLAVSQGAPFWFDLLNKVIVIRSTVKPREKSQVQPSKDRPAPDTEEETIIDDNKG